MDVPDDTDTAGSAPASWESDVVLRDGQTVHIRPIRVSDASELERFHARQSPESVYFRYFSPRPTLSARELRHLTALDHRDRVAFVATQDDRIIGVARYERYRGTNTAEVAFFVDDEHHGRGLATLLLEFLAAAALENGLRRFTATTLPNNRRMLKVFQSAGYEVASRLTDGVVEVAFDIDRTGAAVAAMDRRERAAEAASVRPLLWPASVAVLGAGRQGGLGSGILANLQLNGYAGEIYPVNRHADEIGGIRAVRDAAELPADVDLVVVAVPADEVPDALDAAGRRGARTALVLSAGFSEAGDAGTRLESLVVETARRHGMRLLGPNALGVINAHPSVRLDATPAPELPRAGRIAMLTEAGTLSAAIVEHARRMDLGVSTMVASGNRADVSETDLLSFWSEDDTTEGVLLYLVARNLRQRFVRAARAASLRMPVAALHTSMGSAAGEQPHLESRRRAAAMFRQTGVIRVSTLEQLFDIGRIVSDQPAPAGRGVAVIGNSDGAVALAGDACLDAGLDLVPVTLQIPSGTWTGNPIDLRYTATPDEFRLAIDAAAETDGVDIVLIISAPPQLRLDEELVEVILEASASHPTVTFAATMLGSAGRARLAGERHGRPVGVPIYRFPEDAARALGRLARHADWRATAGTAPAVDEEVGDLEAAHRALEGPASLLSAHAEVHLDSHEQERLLAAFGVPIIERRVVHDVASAVAAAEELGWPVALKAATRNRLTRAASSGVALDLADAEQIELMWTRMEGLLGTGLLPATVQRFLESGIDVAVMVRRDEDGSGTVEVGFGGPAAILGEFELGVLPLTLSDASTLVAASPVGRVLTDPLDRVPVVEVVHRLAAMVADLDVIRSVVADPVVVTTTDAAVADIQVTLGPPPADFPVRRLEPGARATPG